VSSEKKSQGLSSGLALLGACLILGLIYFLFKYTLQDLSSVQWIKSHIYYPTFEALHELFVTPVFYMVVGVILLVERLFPADPKQKTFSPALIQDTCWLIIGTMLEATVVVVYIKFLESIYETHLSFLTVEAIRQLPESVCFIWGILFSDFLAWIRHYNFHKLPWLWPFHTIHHSQRTINMFTDLRYHVLEYLVDMTIRIIPMLILTVDTPLIVTFEVFVSWFTKAYHGNIKTNLGWLRYIIVTPQSHRIHHSLEPRHRDKNFGTIFSIWDYMFRTQYRRYDEYPETGLEDTSFPHDQYNHWVDFLLTPLKQMIYPFVALSRYFTRRSP